MNHTEVSSLAWTHLSNIFSVCRTGHFLSLWISYISHTETGNSLRLDPRGRNCSQWQWTNPELSMNPNTHSLSKSLPSESSAPLALAQGELQEIFTLPAHFCLEFLYFSSVCLFTLIYLHRKTLSHSLTHQLHWWNHLAFKLLFVYWLGKLFPWSNVDIFFTIYSSTGGEKYRFLFMYFNQRYFNV